MTKEEIQKVLDLSLEYYKLEIFGTKKEIEASIQERVDWIYERMKNPSFPSNLDEAAEQYAPDFSNDFASKAAVEAMRDAFKAGAEWLAEQGDIVWGNITRVGDRLDVETLEYLPEESEFEKGDKVIIQIRKIE